MEITKSGIAGTVVVLIVVVVCVRLGLWQLDRRDQRLERNTAVAERMAEEPMALAAIPADTVGITHRRVTVRGRYDHDRSFVLGARSHRGVPGVYVFTPMRLHDGAILVNRGFVPSPDAATVEMEALSRPPEASVTGMLLAFPDVPITPATEPFQTRWFRLDGQSIRAQYPYDLATLYLLDTGPEGASNDGSTGSVDPLPLGPPELDAGSHLSYAVQWFSFATIFLVGWLALLLRRSGKTATSSGTGR